MLKSQKSKYSLRNTFAALALLAATAAQASVTVVVPDGMVLVQGGSLKNSDNVVITVSNSFYIGKYEVTWAEWQTVRTWAATNGYDIESAGIGTPVGTGTSSVDNHPVRNVSWCDVVKWCNARSQKEGRKPVYYLLTVGGAIYTNGTGGTKSAAVVVNASATGYRLPTDAEWEFAARP